MRGVLAQRRSGRPIHVAVLVGVGFLLVQTAWILAVPPFRAIDEFDHVYRAAAVADGQWAPSEIPAASGRGGLLAVPPDLVEAARPQCESLPYTGPENCGPGIAQPDGSVLIASAASTQTPLLYAVLGHAAKPFDGATADYVMRFASALLSAAMVALAAWCVAVWATTRRAMLALLAVTTPVLVYSTVVPAGNGLEMVSAVALWAALLGAGQVGDPRGERRLLLAAVPAALCLVTLRQLGPVFALVIVAIAVLVIGIRPAAALARRQVRVVAPAVAITVLAVAAHVAWVLSAGYGTTDDDFGPYSVRSALVDLPLWFLQGFATGPYRDQPAPLLIYPALALVWLTIFGFAWRTAAARARIALGAAVAVSMLLPLTFATLSHRSMGSFWQGRYGLAVTVGVVMTAGTILERRGLPSVREGRLVTVALMLIVLAQVSNPVGVFLSERGRSVSAADPAWWAPQSAVWGTVLLVVVALAGCALLVRGLYLRPEVVPGPALSEKVRVER